MGECRMAVLQSAIDGNRDRIRVVCYVHENTIAECTCESGDQAAIIYMMLRSKAQSINALCDAIPR